MKKLFTLFNFLVVFSFSGYSQAIWYFLGGGDNTSWNDANNWNSASDGSGTTGIPAAGDEARLTLNNSIITGTVPANPGNVSIGGAKTVTLDLNLTINGNLNNQHGVVLFNNGILNLATGRTLTVNVPISKEAFRLNSAKTNTVNIASGATVNIQQCLNGLFIEDATHNFNNAGTINISGATANGINLIAGTLTNTGTIGTTSTCPDGIEMTGGTLTNNNIINISGASANGINLIAGTLTNTGTISVTSTCPDGIEMAGGTLTNNNIINISGASANGILHTLGTVGNGGTLAITCPAPDGIDYDGGTFSNTGMLTVNGPVGECVSIAAAGFSNAGTMNLTAVGVASGNNCIDVQPGGTFTNNSGGSVTANGGSGSARAISVVGTLNNFGTITLSGGNVGRSLSNDGGTITNQACAIINLTNTRMNNNVGTLTNNGLVKTTAAEGMLSPGTAINNAFFSFGASTWVGTDNGVDLGPTTALDYSLSGGCTVDFNAAKPDAMTQYAWSYNANNIGMNATNGQLALTNVFPNQAGPHTLTTQCPNYAAAFTITVSNIGAFTTYYADADADGYGNPAVSMAACSPPSGFVVDNTDCNDGAASIHPGAPEICGNMIDENCDNAIDEETVTWTGAGDGTTWTDNANWNTGLAPQVCSHVVIPATSNVVLAAGMNAVGKTLQVDPNAVLTVDQTAIMTIQN